MRYITAILFIISISFACVPYDSNKTNTKLLQGKWLMSDMYYIASDSSVIDEYEPKDSIILYFEENNYWEYLSSNAKNTSLNFEVSDYRIVFYKDSSIFDWTNINLLTPDSLVLSKANRTWRYTKFE